LAAFDWPSASHTSVFGEAKAWQLASAWCSPAIQVPPIATMPSSAPPRGQRRRRQDVSGLTAVSILCSFASREFAKSRRECHASGTIRKGK
jgi:hypothetical protein